MSQHSTVTRLNLSIPRETRKRLEKLQAATGAATLTETIANALRVHEWMSQQRRAGREILIRDPGGEPTLVEFIY